MFCIDEENFGQVCKGYLHLRTGYCQQVPQYWAESRGGECHRSAFTSLCSQLDWGYHIPVREPWHLWDKLDVQLSKILAMRRNKGVPQSSWKMVGAQGLFGFLRLQGGALCSACRRGSWYDRGKQSGLKGSQSMGIFLHYKWKCCRH